MNIKNLSDQYNYALRKSSPNSALICQNKHHEKIKFSQISFTDYISAIRQESQESEERLQLIEEMHN